MIVISEGNAAVFISLLHSKRKAMQSELVLLESKGAELSDDELQDSYELQDCIERYGLILDDLRGDYEAALASGVNLPSFAALTQ